MAGDWIKIREDLHEDPAVLKMSEKLRTRPEHVVGYCVRFWSWVSRNTHDGVVQNVTLEAVENVLNLPQFLHILCDVGWLEYIEETSGTQLIIPNFSRHLSESAKKRATDAERKRQARNVSAKRPQNVRKKTDRTRTREEKRRVEKSIKKDLSTKDAKNRAPTLDELKAFWSEHSLKGDPEAMFDHYTSNGWVQGRGKAIKDWRAAARGWSRRQGEFSPASKSGAIDWSTMFEEGDK